MMASGMTLSEKKRALWEAFREIRLDSEQSPDVNKGEKGTKNMISSDILSAGCGSCSCCQKIANAYHNGSWKKGPTAHVNMIAPTPSTQQSTENSRSQRCWEQDDTVSQVQDRSLTIMEADSIQASAEVTTKKKRRKRRVLLSLPSLTRKKASKQKASTPIDTQKSSTKTLFESETASTEQKQKRSSQNGKAEANTKTAKPKVARTKKTTDKETAAQKKLSQNGNVELNVNIAKQKQTKSKKKIVASEDSPSTSPNKLENPAVTKISKSVKQKLNFSNSTSPQESEKVVKRNAKKRRFKSRWFDSAESEDSAEDEDPEYLNKSVTVNASTKSISSLRKKKKTNKEGLPHPLEISETLKSQRRPSQILANIDNQVFKISVQEDNAKFTKNLSRKLGRRGGSSLNSSVLNESVNFKPTDKKKKLYSDRAWTNSQLFLSLCGQSE